MLGIFVVGLWALATFASRVLRTEMERLTIDQQGAAVAIVAASIDDELKERLSALALTAEQVSPATVGHPPALQTLLEERPILHVLFNGGIFVTGTDGTATASIPLSAARRGVNYLDRDFILAALKEGKATVGRAVLGKQLKVPVFVIGAPIRDAQGKVIGVLAGVTDLGQPGFLDKLTGGSYGKSGGYLLMSRQQRQVITATDRSRIMEILPTPGLIPTMDRFLAGYEGSTIFTNRFGIERLASSKRIPAADWMLVAELPTQEAFAAIGHLQRRLLMATLLITLLAGGLTWWVLRRQLAPMLATASDLAARLQSPYAAQPLPVTSQDEIGELVGAFNHLLATKAQAEETLRHERHRLASIISGTNVGTWEWNVQTGETLFSERWASIIGFTLAELAPVSIETWMKFAHPEDLKASGELLEKHFRGELDFYDFESRMQHKDGTWVWVLDRGRVSTWTEDGKPLLMMGTHTDITERKQVEEDLKKSEERHRLLADNAADVIWTLDLEGQFTYVSPSVERLRGYTPAEVMRQTLAEALTPESAEIAQKGLASSLEAVQKGQPTPFFRGELEQPCKDGSTVWTEVTTTGMTNHEGGFIGILGVTRDITERKQLDEALRESMERLEFALQGGELGTWDYYPETGTVLYGDLWAKMLEYQPDEVESTMEFFREHIHPDDFQNVFDRVAKHVDGFASSYQSEHRLRTKSGRWLWVADRGKVVERDPEGHPLRIAGIITDITERKQLEAVQAALEAQHNQIQKAESLGLMAGSIAHHFNNKLQAVMANLEVLSALPKAADPTKYLAMAKLASVKAAEVSRQMLVYLGNSPGERNLLVLGELCTASLPRLQQALPDGVTLERACPAPGPVSKVNAEQLEQVLTNLVTNAGEAMGAAGGSVRLSLSTCPAAEVPTAHRFPIGWQPQGPDYACLEVADNGAGIASADIEKLYDPFFSTKFTGRGLGLSVVLGLVQGHDGAITVESTQGRGSVFRVYLPVSTEEVPSLPERAVQAPGHEGGGTLLLVDDDEMLLESACALLDLLGFTVLTAQDGIEAMKVFRQHQAEIRCVVTDLTMPRLDGWGLLTALRQLDPNLPVILASGYDKAQVLAGTHSDRPQAFLSKPFDLEQLRDALGQALVTSSSAGLR